MKQLVDFTSAVFDALGYLNKFHGLVKTVNRSVDGEVKKYPAKIGFEEVPIDFEPKMAYMRLGQVTTVPLDEDACSRRVTKSFPFTLVVGLPEDILSTPNEYIALKVAQNISNSLQSTQTNSLRTAIKADDVEVNISDIQTDPYTVWTTERNDHYEYPTDRILLSMEVTFVIQGHVSCFDILGCDDEETELVQQYTDSDGVVKDFPFGGHPVCIPAGECADGNVRNSDTTYTATVASGGTLVLPDISFTDSDGTVSSVPAQTDIVATPCVDIDAYTCAQLNDEATGLTQTQRDFIQKVNTSKTGQTISYTAGDDGDLERGRQVDFFTLTCNNPSGNTSRFEAATISGGAILYDWLTGLMWKRSYETAATIAAGCAAAEAKTFAGFTDWHFCNANEMSSILNYSSAYNRATNWPPMSLFENNVWFGSTSRANGFGRLLDLEFAAVSVVASSNSFPYLICRNI